MSLNLHITFSDERGRLIKAIALYQTPSNITKQFFKNNEENEVILTKKNFKEKFLKPYVEWLHTLYGYKNTEDFYREWTKEKNKYLQSIKEDISTFGEDIIHQTSMYKYYTQDNPKILTVYKKIFDCDTHTHIKYVTQTIEEYISKYKCKMWAM